MGASGPALSAGVSFSIGAAVLIALWIKNRLRLKHVRSGWLQLTRLKRLLNIGYPAAIEQGVMQIGFFIFLTLIGNFYGTEAFAAYNIGVNLLTVCMTVGFGFAIAGATLVGQHIGADDQAGATRSGWRAMRLAMLTMSSLGFLLIRRFQGGRWRTL